MHNITLAIPHEQRPFGGDDVLIYYDGPLLFFLPVPEQRLLAIALPADAGTCPFLVVELTEEQARAMLANEVTLRSVVLAASGAWFMPDYGADSLVLEPRTSIPQAWLPGDVRLQLEDPK